MNRHRRLVAFPWSILTVGLLSSRWRRPLLELSPIAPSGWRASSGCTLDLGIGCGGQQPLHPGGIGGSRVDTVHSDAARRIKQHDWAILGCLSTRHTIDIVWIDAARVGGKPEPEAVREYRGRLGSVPVEELDRFALYSQARSDDLALSIVTADVRTYANLLPTIGVRSNY